MEPINDVMELFRHQRAVRAWSDRPVSDEVVRQVLDAAVHGPSGSNSQLWRFIVIRDQQVKDEVSALYEEAMAEPQPKVLNLASLMRPVSWSTSI